MTMTYTTIIVYTSEEARWQGRPVWDAIVDLLHHNHIPTRCMVSKGFAGCYENGELASSRIEIMSYNMPVKIEILLPQSAVNQFMPGILERVTDGVVMSGMQEVMVHRTQHRLIPRHLRVRDAMTATPDAVPETLSVTQIVELLLTHIYNAVPVIDKDGRPIGIVTQGDLIRRAKMPIRVGLLSQLHTEEQQSIHHTMDTLTARDVMTRPVRTISQDSMLSEAVDTMLKHHLKRLPVVDKSGKLVGMIARLDVFRLVTSLAPDWNVIKSPVVQVANEATVHDIMRSDPHTVSVDTPIEQVARLIDDSDLQHVAVVDEDNRLVGLISDADLLALFEENHPSLWAYLFGKMTRTDASKRHQELLNRYHTTTARDVMKVDLVTVSETTPLDEAIALMVDRQIKMLPVVDADSRFQGVISRNDVLRAGVSTGQQGAS